MLKTLLLLTVVVLLGCSSSARIETRDHIRKELLSTGVGNIELVMPSHHYMVDATGERAIHRLGEAAAAAYTTSEDGRVGTWTYIVGGTRHKTSCRIEDTYDGDAMVVRLHFTNEIGEGVTLTREEERLTVHLTVDGRGRHTLDAADIETNRDGVWVDKVALPAGVQSLDWHFIFSEMFFAPYNNLDSTITEMTPEKAAALKEKFGLE